MDDLITTYIDTKYTPEMAEIIYRALGLFSVFGNATPVLLIVDAISLSQDEHPEVIMDAISIVVDEGLDHLYLAHRITLSENISMTEKVQILEAIYGFQFQETYEPFSRILNNCNISPRMQFLEVISIISGIDVPNLEDMIDEVYEGTVDRLKEYVESGLTEEAETPDFEMLKKVRRNLLSYSKAFGSPKISVVLEGFEFQYGCPFDTYFNILRDEIINTEDMETTTYGLLWLALISSDGVDSPQKLLIEKTDSLFDNIMQINQYNAMLSKALGRFQEFKEHENEKV